VNERDLNKNAVRRLAIRHASYRSSAPGTRRYETKGLAGLWDCSSRLAYCPHETSSEVESPWWAGLPAAYLVWRRRCDGLGRQSATGAGDIALAAGDLIRDAP